MTRLTSVAVSSIIKLDSLDLLMKTPRVRDWQLQEAKNRLSEVVDLAATSGPQTITRHGKPAAVLLSARDYQRIKKGGKSLPRFFGESPLRRAKLAFGP